MLWRSFFVCLRRKNKYEGGEAEHGTQNEVFDAEVMGEQLKKLRKKSEIESGKICRANGHEQRYHL